MGLASSLRNRSSPAASSSLLCVSPVSYTHLRCGHSSVEWGVQTSFLAYTNSKNALARKMEVLNGVIRLDLPHRIVLGKGQRRTWAQVTGLLRAPLLTSVPQAVGEFEPGRPDGADTLSLIHI